MDILMAILALVLAIPVLIVGFYFIVMIAGILFGLGATTVKGAKDTADILNNPEINERGQPMVNRDELLGTVKVTLLAAAIFAVIIYALFSGK